MGTITQKMSLLIFLKILTSHSKQHGDVQVIFLKMQPKFIMAARDQLQIFLWAQSQRLFKFYNHILHNMEMCFTEIQNGHHG